MIRYWVLLLWTVNVFAWTEVKNGAECADFHHKDYMFNALNEKFTRASDKSKNKSLFLVSLKKYL